MLAISDWIKEFVHTELTSQGMGDNFYSLGFAVEKIEDDIIDLEITPNRGDAASIYGLSRELSAKLGLDFKAYSAPINAYLDKLGSSVSIADDAQNAVWRYSYIIAKGGKIEPSDAKIQGRLIKIGLNPKNNIIDLTNYLMHESGQPLHAFDLDKINQINICYAKPGETADFINHPSAKLSEDNLVAKDGDKIIDLMGITGGQDSAISDTSKNILIQAAIFDPKIVRRSSKTSGIRTAASYRYERGIDYDMPPQALNKIVIALKKWGFKITEIVDAQLKKPDQKYIIFNFSDVKKLTGLDVNEDDARRSLVYLGFEIGNDKIKVPSWRLFDIYFPEDITEEIIRVAGYDKITPAPLKQWSDNKINYLYNDIRADLQTMGYTECLCYSFINAKELAALDLKNKNIVEIKNPLSENNKYMRPSLLPKLVQAMAANQWDNNLTLYEIGNIFIGNAEETHIGIISFTENKLIKRCIAQKIKPESNLGQLYKLRKTCYYTEFKIDKFVISAPQEIQLSVNKYRTISKFPPVVRDIAILVDQNIIAQSLSKDLTDKFPNVLLALPFDEFTSEKFNGRKSIAIRILLQELSSSLTVKQAEELMQAIIHYLSQKYEAEIRQ